MSTPERPVALVTGSTRPRRVGFASARALARSGCDLILTYRENESEAQAAITTLRQAGAANVRVEPLDLDNLASVEAFSANLAKSLPRLDIFIHNASIYSPTPLETLTADEALRFYRVNALAPLLLSRTLAPMLARSPRLGGGSIVAMCDIHAMGEAGIPRTTFAAYSLSKAALLEMVVVLARALAPRVRVNAVAPGAVAFPEHGHESDTAAQQRYLAQVPLQRAGTPEDAAEAVRWLAMDAHYTTGQVIRVDGGRALT